MVSMRVFIFPFLGCLNGGGQLKASSTDDSKELLKKVTELYKSSQTQSVGGNEITQRLYNEWLGGDNTESEIHKQSLTTQYHAVEKMTNALTIKW